MLVEWHACLLNKTQDECQMHIKGNLKKSVRYIAWGLPLAGVIISSLLPLTGTSRQLLILILLIWLQVQILFESYLAG